MYLNMDLDIYMDMDIGMDKNMFEYTYMHISMYSTCK